MITLNIETIGKAVETISLFDSITSYMGECPEDTRLEKTESNNHDCMGSGVDIYVLTPTIGVVWNIFGCNHRNCNNGAPDFEEGDIVSLPGNTSWREAMQYTPNETSFSNAGETKILPGNLSVVGKWNWTNSIPEFCSKEHEIMFQNQQKKSKTSRMPECYMRLENGFIHVVRHMDLVEFRTPDTVFHIPAPFFRRTEERRNFLRKLKEFGLRTNEFFKCPLCGQGSYYTAACDDCYRMIQEEELEDGDDDIIPIKNKDLKEALLESIDRGEPITGYRLAYIFGDEDYYMSYLEWERKSFRMFGLFWTQHFGGEQFLSIEEMGIEEEEDSSSLEEDDSEDILSQPEIEIDSNSENNFIEFEVSPTLRNIEGVWQHRHEDRDYWHPVVRIHKEDS